MDFFDYLEVRSGRSDTTAAGDGLRVSMPKKAWGSDCEKGCFFFPKHGESISQNGDRTKTVDYLI